MYGKMCFLHEDEETNFLIELIMKMLKLDPRQRCALYKNPGIDEDRVLNLRDVFGEDFVMLYPPEHMKIASEEEDSPRNTLSSFCVTEYDTTCFMIHARTHGLMCMDRWQVRRFNMARYMRQRLHRCAGASSVI